MKRQLIAISALALCLLGCNESTPPAGSSNASPSTNPPVAAQSAPAATPPAAAASAQASGAITTASGLKYEVLTHGTGTVSPKATDRVKVNYRGTLLDGTEFDSSYKSGQPISFGLNQVIPGWTEGLQLMKVGDKFKFTIPANLAYGPNSPGSGIPPNSTLVFEVELLGIE